MMRSEAQKNRSSLWTLAPVLIASVVAWGARYHPELADRWYIKLLFGVFLVLFAGLVASVVLDWIREAGESHGKHALGPAFWLVTRRALLYLIVPAAMLTAVAVAVALYLRR